MALLLHSAVNCGNPGTPTNGQRSLSSTTYNSVVTYTCDVGYTLQGSNSRTCQSSGQWSGIVPQCKCEFGIKTLIVMYENGMTCVVRQHFGLFPIIYRDAKYKLLV